MAHTGQEVILPCHFPDSSNVDWYRADTKLSHNKALTGAALPWIHRIVGDDTDQEYNLRIKSIDAARDPALYRCRFTIPSDTRVYSYNAHLIIIGNYINTMQTIGLLLLYVIEIVQGALS